MTNHNKLWNRVIPLYLLVAIPVAFLGPMLLGITGPVFIAGFVINWIWIYVLMAIFKP